MDLPVQKAAARRRRSLFLVVSSQNFAKRGATAERAKAAEQATQRLLCFALLALPFEPYFKPTTFTSCMEVSNEEHIS